MFSLNNDNKGMILNKMGPLNANDEMVQVIAGAIGDVMDGADDKTNQAFRDLFFETCSEKMLVYYEHEAGIIPEDGQTIAERKSILETKWKSSGHADVKMIEAIAASWGRSIEVRLEGGTLIIRFIDQFGEPTGIDGFMKSVAEAIPCHLGFEAVARFVTVKEFQTMTIGELQQLIIENFEWRAKE